VTDSSGRVLELRRVEGGIFPAVGGLQERKAHALKDSQKSWPIGIAEAKDAPAIALVEGIPDFITAHHLCLWEKAPHHSSRDTSCLPVEMLSGSPAIHQDALHYFKGKHVRLFPQVDKTGFTGSLKWQQQLRAAGARVDVFDFSTYRTEAGERVKDLEDFVERLDPEHYNNDQVWRVPKTQPLRSYRFRHRTVGLVAPEMKSPLRVTPERVASRTGSFLGS
jgi:hypothetical protein